MTGSMAGTAKYGQHISHALYPLQEGQNSADKGNQSIHNSATSLVAVEPSEQCMTLFWCLYC